MTKAKTITSMDEDSWLLAMSNSTHQHVSFLMDKPPRRIMNSLVAKGLAENVMDTFWKITPDGLKHIKATK